MSELHIVPQWLLLLGAAAAFEFAYVRWARCCSTDRVLATTCWSVATAALGLAGVGGALTVPYGALPYLAGIAVGSYTAAKWRL